MTSDIAPTKCNDCGLLLFAHHPVPSGYCIYHGNHPIIEKRWVIKQDIDKMIVNRWTTSKGKINIESIRELTDQIYERIILEDIA